jgi:hypothetical protein
MTNESACKWPDQGLAVCHLSCVIMDRMSLFGLAYNVLAGWLIAH